MKKQLLAICLFAGLVAIGPLQVEANTNPVTSARDGGLLVNVAGRQRMLSQRITGHVCLINNVGSSTELLRSARAALSDFKIANGLLLDGDLAKGIGPESNPRLRAMMEDLIREGEIFGLIAEALMSKSEPDPTGLAELDAQGLVVLRQANALTGELAQFYAWGAAHPSTLSTVNLAGRQRMLSQFLVKEACFMHANVSPIPRRVSFQSAAASIDRSLGDLRDGNFQTRTPPVTSEAALQKLDVASRSWKALQNAVNGTLAQSASSSADLLRLQSQADEFLGNMHKTVLELQKL